MRLQKGQAAKLDTSLLARLTGPAASVAGEWKRGTQVKVSCAEFKRNSNHEHLHNTTQAVSSGLQPNPWPRVKLAREPGRLA